jgi:acyl dehydratase
MSTAITRYSRPPATLPMYLRGIFMPREPLLPDGVTVAHMAALLDAQRIEPRHLARYRDVCGFPESTLLPVTYPHALALPLQLALMSDARFVVRLMGLVHIANLIEVLRPMPVDGCYDLRASVAGHRDSDRGQEIDLLLEMSDRSGPLWRETTTLLARRPVTGSGAARAARQVLQYEKPPAGTPVTKVPLQAPGNIGRRYGWVSGDINPIHLADVSARPFGFERAVAHGMWSLSRSLAAIDGQGTRVPCRIKVDFKLPVFLPAALQLEHWGAGARAVFVLKDGAGSRPHLAGAIEPLDA